MNILLKIIILFIVIFIGGTLYKLTIEHFLSTSSNAMVIVEPRKHKDLERVLKNFDERMPKNWDLYIFCGKSSQDFAEHASSFIKDRHVIVQALDTDNLTAEEYNTLFKQASFWEKVQAENILVFQTDSILCKESPFNIDNFTSYDYIGCSYTNSIIGRADKNIWNGMPFYGVGGLSFRKKSFMLNCISSLKHQQHLAEDVFFSFCSEKSVHKPVSAKVLNEFCTQGEFHEKSFGAHKTKELSEYHRSKFYEYCPEGEFLKEQFKNLL
jgi:hypothetical protein